MTKETISIPWYYKGEIVTAVSVPEWAVGMVYIIYKYEDKHDKAAATRGQIVNYSKIYIGKKQLTANRKTAIGKRAQAKQKAETGDGRVKKVKIVTKVSNWLSYTGSCKELNEEIAATPELFRKEILVWCYSKKNMSYEETRHQYLYNVMNSPSYNNHIQNWYKIDTDRQAYEEYKQAMKDKPKKPRAKKEIPY